MISSFNYYLWNARHPVTDFTYIILMTSHNTLQVSYNCLYFNNDVEIHKDKSDCFSKYWTWNSTLALYDYKTHTLHYTMFRRYRREIRQNLISCLAFRDRDKITNRAHNALSHNVKGHLVHEDSGNLVFVFVVFSQPSTLFLEELIPCCLGRLTQLPFLAVKTKWVNNRYTSPSTFISSSPWCLICGLKVGEVAYSFLFQVFTFYLKEHSKHRYLYGACNVYLRGEKRTHT